MTGPEQTGEVVLSGQALPPEQAQFQKLLAKIDRARAELDALVLALDGFRVGYATRVNPLIAEAENGKLALLNALDERLSQPGVPPKLRADLSELICIAADDLLDGSHRERAAELIMHHRHGIKGFGDGHRDRSASGGDGQSGGATQAELPLDMESAERLFHETMRRMEAETVARAAAHEAAREAAAHARRARKKPSAKQLAAEQEAKDAVALMRGIYRKLVSALHPDRESDATLRAQKTELLVQVNDAYKRHDLLALLQLQGKAFGQGVDLVAFGASVDAKLRHFNKLLAVQFSDLTAQYRAMQNDFYVRFDVGWGSKITAEKLDRVLRREVKHRADEILHWASVVALSRDDRSLKEWLKFELKIAREDIAGW